MGLQVGSGLDEVGRTDHPADPPTGHCIGLCDAVQHHTGVSQVRNKSANGVVLVSVIGEMLVDLVGDDPDTVLNGPLPDGPDLIGRVDGTRRVGRRHEEQGLGARGTGSLQLVDGHPKP